MRFDTDQPQTNNFQPVSVTLTAETPDELRWLYHAANMQGTEIAKGYRGNRKGSFEERFVDFNTPDKKPLLQYVREQADRQGVDIHQ